MKLIPIILLCLFPFAAKAGWGTDFALAKTDARSAGKTILLSFSGSDWCVPCIRMHKTIFETPAFEAFAGKELVLVNADFPRSSKHKLSKLQQVQNDSLAEAYNHDGRFPYTLLLSANGKVIHAWEGCPNESPEQFVAEIAAQIHGHK